MSLTFQFSVNPQETSIELVVVGEDGVVQSVCEQTVFGAIKDLAILRWSEKFCEPNPQKLGKDLLVVLSDSGKLSFLTFCNEMHRFFPVSHIQLSNPGNSRHQLGRMLAVDSHGCFVAVSAYEERLALFSVSMSAGSNIIDKKIFYPPERKEENTSITQDVQRTSICGTIWSMCFISKDVNRLSKDANNAILAIILHRKEEDLNELILLEWDTGEHAVRVISQYIEDGPLALNIVEVPYAYGFAILFRVGDALLMDLRDPHNPQCVYKIGLGLLPTAVVDQTSFELSCKGLDVDDVAVRALLELSTEMIKGDDPMSIDSENGKASSVPKLMCSWSWEPGNTSNPTMIVSLDTGELQTLAISSDPDGIKINLSECLYTCLPCKTLLWVRGGFIAALVEMGDGMVLEFEKGRLSYRSPIQNIAPILDMSVVDYHDEKQEQMFACCGVAPEGSLRIIRSGISVEKLLRTAPIYQGITGTWTLRMKVFDSFHSFLVLSFVEETRVLKVGLSFSDVTDAVGFQPDACTLACGLVGDRLLVQIHRNAVRLCLPTTAAHPEGIPLSAPICTSWFPDNVNISLGAVGHNVIIVATSNPCFLFILGARSLSAYHYEIYELQHVRLQNEVSCISIPQRSFKHKLSTSFVSLEDHKPGAALPVGVEISNTFVIGTHKPSVEILSFVPEEGLRIVACGMISLTNTLGTAISGCIPQDVRLVLVDRFYILSGLRNGMLLRFEWPAISTVCPSELPKQGPFMTSCFSNVVTSLSSMSPISAGQQYSAIYNAEEAEENAPVPLQLIAIRRIGVTPVFLVPLSDSLDADIIALSDRPWLLQTARHSLSYTSISFQPATHVTPVCSVDCPKGILFVAENSLHLVEMIHSKRLNVQKFYLGGTPRKVLYHSDSRLLIVMRTELSSDPSSSDICCVDPLSGSLLSSYKLEPGETGKSMQLVKVGNEQVLVVGTSQSAGRAIMSTGEAESTKGRLLVLCLEHMQNSDSSLMLSSKLGSSSSQRSSPFREIVGYATEQLSTSSLCSSPDDNSCDGVKLEETEAWQLRLAYQSSLPGVVLAVCPYLDRYVLAAAGNTLFVYGFLNENPQRLRRLAVGRTRFTITCLTAQFTRIAVGDCRDGILFYSYQEDLRKLEQLYCDPVQRLVADCTLMDMDTAVVSDRRGNVTVLSCTNHVEDNASPECNLTLSCSYYIGETVMSIRKGSYSYKLPVDDVLKGCDGANTMLDSSHNSIVASTLLGSVMIFIPISREEYELLQAVQARLVIHPLTAPILGNDHNEFRGRGSQAGVSKMLDGDMLAQFLELTSMQQVAVLALPLGLPATGTSSLMPPSQTPIPVNKVVRLLERVHYALN
ncbi:Cleavage/polyadenylation specificity factor [Macleaya cordata]|uniref:Cleavage/polyadenylation specificity factor n=1 Tax=Macleaya cordata TaxID=56857 RepID=A0A200QA20_MACCD|nr:Cleavage/polyadenylation specificity factor [Macleaya cordata]